MLISLIHNRCHNFLKPQLGRSRTRGHILPSSDFVYGQTYEKLDGGVPEGRGSCYFLNIQLKILKLFY